MKHKVLIIIAIFVGMLLVTIIVEFLMIKNGGTEVPVPNIPRGPLQYGSGQQLTYVVMGDSTAVGQGGDYETGIATSTARYLARSRQVTLHNVAVSGARSSDVRNKQLPQAARLKPDFVLVAVGANDITHLASAKSTVNNIRDTIIALRAVNPAVKIVLTGSPQMGSVPRFPQPVKYFAHVQTGKLNKRLAAMATDNKVVLAPIAEKTGSVFLAHPELFAADNFHPLSAGYDVWIPVLERAIDKAWAH